MARFILGTGIIYGPGHRLNRDCRILLIGYEGFSKIYPNPAELLVKKFSGRKIGKCRIDSHTIPVKLDVVRKLFLNQSILDYNAILGVGVSPGSREPRIELAAANIADYNEGRHGEKRREEIVPGSSLIMETGLPYLELIRTCSEERMLPLRLGLSPGLYLCNALAYMLHRWSFLTGRPGGFIHIPVDTNTAMRLGLDESMPMWVLEKTLECVLQTLAHKHALLD